MLQNLEDYIEEHSSSEPDYLRAITRDTNLNILNPHMLSGQVQGRLLSMLGKMIQPKRILELGTFTGYSALCLAECGAEVVTIEHNDELEETILRNLSLSPWGKNVHLLLGDAKEIIPTLSGNFDMVFVDADKCEYCEYYNLIWSFVSKTGWIIADNTLWDGHIVDSQYDKDKQTLGLRKFNDLIAKDERVEKVILPLRDGLTIIHKL